MALLCISLAACKPEPRLPILGKRELSSKIVDGKTVTDTIYQTVPNFSFIDQDCTVVTNKTFENKVYIADFVFLSCATICPKMNIQMKRVYEAFVNNSHVLMLSHTIDPANDTIAALKTYTDLIEVKSDKWHFVTGNEDSILSIANKGYYIIAYPDSVSGSYEHSGGLVLIDKNRHVRGVYDGTIALEVTNLIRDIKTLLKE